MPDVIYRLSALGGAEVQSAMKRVADAVGTVGDIANKTTTALATGGPTAAAFAAGVGLIEAGMRQWNAEIEAQSRIVSDAKKKEDDWLESAKRGIAETALGMKKLTVEQLNSAAVLADLQVAHVAEARFAALQQMTAAKIGTDERNKYAQLAHDKAVELAASQTAREEAWGKYRVAQNRVLNTEILVNKREEDTEAARIEAARFEKENGDRVRTLDDYKKFLADEKAARLKALADARAAEDLAAKERYKLFKIDNDMYLAAAAEKAKIADETEQVIGTTEKRISETALSNREAAIGRTLYAERIALVRREQAAQDAEERAKARRLRIENADKLMAEGNLRLTEEEYARLETDDDDLTAARIKNRKAEADATVAALQREQLAQRAAAASEYAHAAAMQAMQPVVGAVTEKLQALGEVNRDNAQDFFDFSHELPAIAAKMAQAILAGLAMQAVGKSAFEVAEAAGATAAGTVALFTPGGQASAMGYYTGAAQHMGAAALYAGLAGATASGAGAIGAARGSGGLVPLTSAERKAMNDKNGSGGGSSSASRLGSGSIGGSGGQGGGDVYYINNYESGSIDTANRFQRNGVIHAANLDNARDVFAAREIARSA